MFITEIPQFEGNMTPTVSLVESRELSRNIIHRPNSVYPVFEIPQENFYENDNYTIFGTLNRTVFFDEFDSVSLMTIANIFFGGAKPLIGEEVYLLNKALSKSQSAFPTKL